MEAIQIFNYNESAITFKDENGVAFVNATEMAKNFGKQPKDWLRLKTSSNFLDSLSAVRKIPRTELIAVLQGGNVQGTWMHEDVALEFSRWLSPAFAIWCNDRIKELREFSKNLVNQTLIQLGVLKPMMKRSEVERLSSVRKVESAIKNGHLKFTKKGKNVWFKRDDVTAWLTKDEWEIN